MSTVDEQPPDDPDDWTEDQWREWLANAPTDPESGQAHPLTRAVHSSGGTVLGSAMLGLDQAIFGEKAKAEVVAEAEADGQDDGDIELDLDDPAASRITLHRDA